MRSEFLPFSKPSISEAEIAAVAGVLRSGWITTGPVAAEFERAFCGYVGASGAVSVSSATAGMHLILAALGIGAGDEVITPSLTWVSTVNLILLAGATPVFADVDRDTLMVTPETVAKRISERTALIIPVHFAGAAADVGPMRGLASGRGISLVEDAAHAIGTEYAGERIGRSGTCVFSFHPIKNMTTGEGGIVCSGDAHLLSRIRRLRFHGLGVDAYDRESRGRSPQAEVIEPGYKYNLTDVAAALGLGQLRRVDELNQRRAALAAIYLEKLAEVEEVLPLERAAGTTRHAWSLFVVRLDIDKAGLDRDAFMTALREMNIGTGLHFRAVHLQKYYREHLPADSGSLPNTEWNSDRILSLPLFPDMTGEDVEDVVSAMKEVLAS